MMFSATSFLATLLFLQSVFAANDWSVPCVTGVCEYSLPTSLSSSGSLKIWGDEDVISDITTAAGWEILDCSADAISQDIRLVCTDTSDDSLCANLQQNSGAVDKVVRLPENCGASAFARVADAWVSEDQSIPATLAARFVRRSEDQPSVLALRLDTDFGAIKTGSVNFAIMGANVPGVSTGINMPAVSRRSRISRRGPFDFVTDAINNVKEILDSVLKSAEAVTDGVTIDGNDVNANKTFDLPPIDINQPFNLLNQNISCGPVDASVSVDVDAGAHALVTLGVAASGTLVPPNLDAFSVTAGVSADLNGTINFNAQAVGTLDSGKITLFSLGIPGLDFPGILSIGPSLDINAQAIASLGVGVDVAVGVNYSIKNASLTFPPNDQENIADFNINDTPLALSVTPDVNATGSVEAHLIPTLNLGISALGDVAKAGIFLEFDANAKLLLSANAQIPGVETQIGRRSLLHRRSFLIDRSMKKEDASETSMESASVSTSSVSATAAIETVSASMVHETSSSVSSAMMHDTTTAIEAQSSAIEYSATATASSAAPSASDAGSSDGGFGLTGCIELDAGFAINAGADANFFNLFDESTQATLFEKEFQLFKKCFGTSAAPSRREIMPHLQALRRARRALIIRQDSGLVCPSADAGAPVSVADEKVASKSIKEVK